ncbi:MAG: Arc family DNA-binding protein [Spirochaetia bacterium]|nr:Arc family DNA-binding protein [Spirochaetia bacterium]
MKSIHIRDIDPEKLQRLKKLAEMHHRSMQGELKTIISEAVRKVPANEAAVDLDLVTVSTENQQPWKHEDYYTDAP